EFVSRFIINATPELVSEWIDHGKGNSASRFWTLDPVDGTKGFLRGGQYVVAFALIVDGEVEIGVIGCPNLSQGFIQDPDGQGSIVVAVKNEGTWLVSPQNGHAEKQFKVSDVNNPAAARLLRSFEAGHTSVSHLDQIIANLSTTADPVLLDSQAKYTILASGHGDLLFRLISPSSPNYQEKIWDQAAGSLVVQEAGGMITDLDGKRLDFSQGRTLANNRGVLASNGHLHEAALTAIKAAKA
ncbi:MAG: inositol monophosphatase family protein, partial [Chloroflexota bacterium]